MRPVTDLKSTVEDVNKQVSDNYNSIVELNKKVLHLENENASLKQVVHENTKDSTNRSNEATQDRKLVTELEEEIEDCTNRQLRKTIIIKGVPEEENENWE